MPSFISLILSEIADKLNCTLINAYYFNLKLNVHNNSPSTCIASFTSSTYSIVKMIHTLFRVEKILKGSQVSIPSPSPSVKIQIMGRKLCLRCKGKTLLGIVNKLLKTKSVLTSPSNVLPCYRK